MLSVETNQMLGTGAHSACETSQIGRISCIAGTTPFVHPQALLQTSDTFDAGSSLCGSVHSCRALAELKGVLKYCECLFASNRLPRRSPPAEEYRYETRVKPCRSSASTTDGSTLTSSPRIASTLCSESQCDPTVGEVADFNLTVTTAADGTHGWATTRAHAGFNPVAMKIQNIGEIPW